MVCLYRLSSGLVLTQHSINQSDHEEKSGQIAAMASIYSQASRTIVWLGELDGPTYTSESSKDIEESLCLICSLVKSWNEDAKPIYLKSGKEIEPKIIPLNLESKTAGHQWYTLGRFFDARWFTRRWVVQEVALSRETSVLMGDFAIDWQLIGQASAFIRANYSNCRHYNRLSGVQNAHLIFRLGVNGPLDPVQLTFLQLLRLASRFETTDPKDVIFALLGIQKTTAHQIH
jgi:Heterokaryon incompatibility protein (HET)